MKYTKNYLGLDLSTQGLKAVVIDSDLQIIFETSVNFDKELSEFGTEGGALIDGETVTAPSLMFVKALDMVMEKLSESALNLSDIKSVSGSAQQHGSVWLNEKAKDKLATLDPDKTLAEQLESIFSMNNGPIWMDSSTRDYCLALEFVIGGAKDGAKKLAKITGSRAFERFTGSQIAKYFYTTPEVYAQTERISLISSFMPSLLIGDFAEIDFSDGSGMNLMDINSGQWNDKALNYAGGESLKQKLGTPKASHEVAGNISSYFVEKYGFDKNCKIILFSGDNPNSLAGLAVTGPNDVIVSMGTSDTIFGSTPKASPSEKSGHVFVSPMNPKEFMVMLVRQNGSLTREKVRDQWADGSWETFTEMLNKTPAGNNGNVGIYIYTPEITPPIKNTGVFRFDKFGNEVESFSAEEEVRAVYESQFMSLRLHSKKIGLNPDMIIATGGASVDKALTQMIADVFGKPVAVGETPDSAAMGAAYRALHGYVCDQAGKYIPYTDVTSKAVQPVVVSEPNKKNHSIYSKLLGKFKKLEKTLS
ncbi:MAG: FGGY-family carbohydrate kinase [Kiritimatiellae bacterium]|jgi:xylulokinase|nr:FGGY-family carbohydrate kinase [Kiritimatiellia bacterium]